MSTSEDENSNNGSSDLEGPDTGIRLDVPRHLQDFNGYCGPACALMVIDYAGSRKSPPVFAQNEYFREVRRHAKENSDRRPIKSPAESLLHLINDHAAGETRWEKIYQPDPQPVAEAILQAVEGRGNPCMMMINRGMHWVVAFGILKKPDGTPSGLLMRDPAWAGMPRFYGLSIFPEKPAIEHGTAPCSCLDHTDAGKNERTGKVHERFFTIEELLSHRGLQGSPDWEGEGAIALVPVGTSATATRLSASLAAGIGAAGIPVANARENAGQAALAAVRDSGLTGHPDSPPEWDAALRHARAGEPILVKDPEDSRDDFFLVPLIPADPAAPKGAWAMLDTRTLALREVSLLEDWQAPVLPTRRDAEQAANQNVVLADGTTARFSAADLAPNTRNLVWKASAAAVLPYWPAKEFTAPHPMTGLSVPVYLTQDGEVFGQFSPDPIDPPAIPAAPAPVGPSKSPLLWKVLAGLLATTSLALALAWFLKPTVPADDFNRLLTELARLQEQRDALEKENQQLKARIGERPVIPIERPAPTTPEDAKRPNRKSPNRKPDKQ